MLKEFDRQRYNIDDTAKFAVIDMLKKHWNCDVRVNRDRYAIDLVGKFDDGSLFGVEVEIKHNWTSPHFMFESVHYAARKTKFIDVFPNVYFCTLNHPRTHALIINMQTIDHMRMVRKQTSVTTTEWFMEIPTHLFDKYEL